MQDLVGTEEPQAVPVLCGATCSSIAIKVEEKDGPYKNETARLLSQRSEENEKEEKDCMFYLV